METDQLAELIEEKRQILVQLCELGRRQSQLIQHGDMTKLLSLLAAKQAALGKLQSVEKQLDPFRAQDPESRQWRSPQLRQRARQAASESETLLQEIMQVEHDCETQLSLRRDEAATRLQGVHDKTQARSAYLQESPARRTRFDISSES